MSTDLPSSWRRFIQMLTEKQNPLAQMVKLAIGKHIRLMESESTDPPAPRIIQVIARPVTSPPLKLTGPPKSVEKFVTIPGPTMVVERKTTKKLLLSFHLDESQSEEDGNEGSKRPQSSEWYADDEEAAKPPSDPLHDSSDYRYYDPNDLPASPPSADFEESETYPPPHQRHRGSHQTSPDRVYTTPRNTRKPKPGMRKSSGGYGKQRAMSYSQQQPQRYKTYSIKTVSRNDGYKQPPSSGYISSGAMNQNSRSSSSMEHTGNNYGIAPSPPATYGLEPPVSHWPGRGKPNDGRYATAPAPAAPMGYASQQPSASRGNHGSAPSSSIHAGRLQYVSQPQYDRRSNDARRYGSIPESRNLPSGYGGYSPEQEMVRRFEYERGLPSIGGAYETVALQAPNSNIASGYNQHRSSPSNAGPRYDTPPSSNYGSPEVRPQITTSHFYRANPEGQTWGQPATGNRYGSGTHYRVQPVPAGTLYDQNLGQATDFNSEYQLSNTYPNRNPYVLPGPGPTRPTHRVQYGQSRSPLQPPGQPPYIDRSADMYETENIGKPGRYKGQKPSIRPEQILAALKRHLATKSKPPPAAAVAHSVSTARHQLYNSGPPSQRYRQKQYIRRKPVVNAAEAQATFGRSLITILPDIIDASILLQFRDNLQAPTIPENSQRPRSNQRNDALQSDSFVRRRVAVQTIRVTEIGRVPTTQLTVLNTTKLVSNITKTVSAIN